MPQKINIQDLLNGNRRSLAQALTLVESQHAKDQELASELLQRILPKVEDSVRIGISGAPGVGKSTLIETLGLMYVQQGFKVAVIAVDPSSEQGGGSILGDKTRMETLSVQPQAFIRPSPNSGVLGGVGRKTFEMILLFEAAGYQRILVETVGVGQSEIQAAKMVDFFMILLLPNAGDGLQGIKKGILEMADLLWVNKADQSSKNLVHKAVHEFSGALKWFKKRHSFWQPNAFSGSALQKEGIETIVTQIEQFCERSKNTKSWLKNRELQKQTWANQLLKYELFNHIQQHPKIQKHLPEFAAKLTNCQITPQQAIQALLKHLN